MNALYFSPPTSWEPSSARTGNEHMSSVAFSVAEAALKSGPSSPSFGQSMSQMMDAAPLGATCGEPAPLVGSFPRLKHKSSFAGRPLWDVVEHAKRRREEKQTTPIRPATPASYIPSSSVDAADDDSNCSVDEVIVTPRSSNLPAFLRMREVSNALPRLSGRDFATNSEHKAATTAHGRTQSDEHNSVPSEVLRSQASHSPLTRLPSLAQIKAKMTPPIRTSGEYGRRPNGRSDSLDSNDSAGPQTPTEEWTSFDFQLQRAPDTPSKEASRLAPFLRERTNGRLARPKSVPPIDTFGSSLPSDSPWRTRPAPLRTARLSSLPATPPVIRRLPVRSWTVDADEVTLIVTPPQKVSSSPTSPTESEHSIVSSTFSLPIITCTPADEEDSDVESEGDVVVFAGDLEENDDSDELEELEEERREREFLGREMLFRLSRRSS